MELGLLKQMAPFFAVIVGVILTAVINITLRFSENKQSAFRDVFEIIVNFIMFLANAWLMYILYREVTSPAPLSRASVFVMILCSISLFWFVISLIINKIIKFIREIIGIQREHLNITRAFSKNPDDK